MRPAPGRRPSCQVVGVLLWLVAALVGAGCSTVPGESAVVPITREPARATDVEVSEPGAPEAGATPDEVVRGFIEASASRSGGHPVAREYLAPDVRDSWSDSTGITVLDPGYATVRSGSGTVRVTAKIVGKVDVRGVLSISAGEPSTFDFTLDRIDDEWRITDPDDGLLMLQPDFERLYDKVDVYFVDPTNQRVVPDPRYLISGDAQPTALVERLLTGPSAALGPGVTNALAGAGLNGTVAVSPSAVTIDLAGIADLPPQQLTLLCAQLVWTLDQIDAPAVRILADGTPLRLDGVPAAQTVGNWATFNPDAVPFAAIGHYLDGSVLRTVDGQPAPGPAGQGGYPLTSAAISADPGTGVLDTMAGVVVSGAGRSLLVGSYGSGLTEVGTRTTLTEPTVAATRAEFWTVADGTEIVRVSAGGPPASVTAPGLAALGRATALQLSPDGVRAALVIDNAGRTGLYVGTVVRSGEVEVALRDLRPVAPSLTEVLDVAWSAADQLMVLGAVEGAEDVVPYTLGVDGWNLTPDTTAGLPVQPDSLAAAPGQSPLVSAGGTMWQRSGGIWVTLIRGQQPLPGAAPLFPS